MSAASAEIGCIDAVNVPSCSPANQRYTKCQRMWFCRAYTTLLDY